MTRAQRMKKLGGLVSHQGYHHLKRIMSRLSPMELLNADLYPTPVYYANNYRKHMNQLKALRNQGRK